MKLARISLIALVVSLFAHWAQAQVLPMNFVVVAVNGVTLNGEALAVGDSFTFAREDDEDDEVLVGADDFVFTLGAESFLVIRDPLTGVIYNVPSAAALGPFITAYENRDGGGEALGRYVFGGNRQRFDLSTITSTTPVTIPEVTPVVNPSNQPATAVAP